MTTPRERYASPSVVLIDMQYRDNLCQAASVGTPDYEKIDPPSGLFGAPMFDVVL